MRARRERSSLPRVALAGYTNAGKSTLLNALTGAEVGVGDRLFHTLDPTTRSVELSGRDYLLTDTVGFIEKLPHQLVEAFKATLEETVLADLILHVVDAAAPEERRLADMRAVDEVLEEIGAGDKPRLLVLNKADLLDDERARRGAAAPSRRGARLGARPARASTSCASGSRRPSRTRWPRSSCWCPTPKAAVCTSCTSSPATSSGSSATTASSSAPRSRSPSCTASTTSQSSRVRGPWSCRVGASWTTSACCPPAPHEGDAGLDLYAGEAAHIGPGERWSVGTGVAVEIPEGHAGPGAAPLRTGEEARDRAGQRARA